MCFACSFLIYCEHDMQEMLSRSSLETQKLELMSAMSELKLHQTALERENIELRSTHFNNNTITAERRPPIPASRIRTNSTSGTMVTYQILFVFVFFYDFRDKKSKKIYFCTFCCLVFVMLQQSLIHDCVFFVFSVYFRHHHQHIVVKLTFNTTVYHVPYH